ncbi:MAG: mitochondrial fission ELM1 family protein [Geminicoccaceae bacterium]|nr:mitochondrial fission ELM1 family protein [Geminicoccaceae bacterium]MDW8370804.1 ELM1/GtrOC1 family putative glycosyltransferase [Geminicoccaceae bacterium]
MPVTPDVPWPYFRREPECVVLEPRAGAPASAKPPVRIFLGTEPAQYRAERIFFWSIEKHRDPGRRYEIYRMSDLEGFDRTGWRTGFTKYRFAIPELAGGSGRAIYNDVDQIYLADPAELFDLEMGEHGYLAISPEETSVMLIDCAKMLPLWNRTTATREGKHALIKKPASVPGLWGPCDPHWNARDQEYVEGRTKCLHYTALHQQPWEPFPEDYSYHPNPLAYIWHGLEREADAAGYQMFGPDRPSPTFRELAAGETPPPAEPRSLSEEARRLLAESGAGRLLAVGFGCAPALQEPPAGLAVASVDLARDPALAAVGPADAVLALDLFDRLPPADIGWVLDLLFARAGRLVLVDVRARAAHGFASPLWWRRRLLEAARRRPGPSWHLEVRPDPRFVSEGVQRFTVRRVVEPPSPRVWVLATGEETYDRQAIELARALGWPYETRRLVLDRRFRLPNFLLGASLAGVDRLASTCLEPPWPDLLITSGRKSVPAALWIRRQSGGRTRLVQIGRPRAPFELFDLIVATPQARLPLRENVLPVAAPLAGIPAERLEAARAAWADRLDALPRPRVAFLLGRGRDGYRLDHAPIARATSRLVEEVRASGGSLLVALDRKTPAAVESALRGALREVPHILHRADAEEGRDARTAFLAAADRVVVTADEIGPLAEACLAGKPARLVDLPRWYDRLPGGARLARFLRLLVGGGTSYRGTPHQQHLLARLVDHLATRGLVNLPRDPAELHRALLARGLVERLDAPEPMARPVPLDDLRRVAERVRGMMAELPSPA